jgi:hypothetical protein
MNLIFPKIRAFIENPFFWSFITQILIICIVSYLSFFRGNGFQVYVDVTEGTSLTNAYNKYIYTFDDNWGEAIAEKQRAVFITPLFVFYNAFKIAPENFIPFKFLYFYILSALSITITLYIISKDTKYFEKKEKTKRSNWNIYNRNNKCSSLSS